ncbi:MAG TPA: nuclear transport factor 2 family protein [Candidatus Binataceae bacterium]|nr:nuclear transport factor 2 family protein [Candidatus Binataceae bacterium]
MSDISARVAKWKSAWESRAPERVAAMYLPVGTHQSAKVEQLYPELGRGMLRGRQEIAEYARRAFARFTHLNFEILTTTEEGERSAVEYRRHSNLDEAKPAYVLELIDFSNGLIQSCRVFNF